MPKPARPDHDKLFEVASQQSGYFTAKQARQCGFSADLIKRHVRSRRFLRVRRGLYRIQRYPTTAQENVVEAWLSAGPQAVISHESALSLHGLSDIVASKVHLTVPRSHRWVAGRVPREIAVHTTTKALSSDAVTTHGPVRVTTPARSIVDAAEAGTGPEQILLSIRQALDQGLTTSRELRAVASGRSSRVEQLVLRGIEEATAA